MDRVLVGQRLRTFLTERFVKLKIGSDKLGVSESHLQMYLKGKRLPGSVLLSKLSSLGCDIEWLLLKKQEPSYADMTDFEIKLNMKDKIILSQAEEIQELREEIKKLKGKKNNFKFEK